MHTVTEVQLGLLLENAGAKLLDAALDSAKYSAMHQLNYEGLNWALRQVIKQ